MPDNESPTRTPTMAALPLAIALAVAGLQAMVLDDGAGGTTTVLAPLESVDEASFLAGLTELERVQVDEHVFEGLPATRNVAVHQGYVRGYSQETRGPTWVAYHVIPDYVDVPERNGILDSFLVDKTVPNRVSDSDYTGLQQARGFDRGHLAPYGVMGGDRNRNGVRAPSDDFDVQTIRQANLLSNIVPQHKRFNSGGGVWFQLEQKIQKEWVERDGREVWVFAGAIVGIGQHEVVGRDDDIVVPPVFFKIVIRQPDAEEMDAGQDLPKVLAFLLPHHRFAHGVPRDFLVPVDVIETLTGLDFFHHLDSTVEAVLEDTDTFCTWPLFETADAGDPAFEKCSD